MVSTTFLFILGTNVLVLAGLVLLSRGIARFYLSNDDLIRVVGVFAVAMYLGLSRLFVLSLLRIYERAFIFIVIVFVDFLLLIALTIWFITGLHWGLWGVIYAKVISGGLVFLAALIFVLKNYGLGYDHPAAKRSLRYGFPLIFHGISLLVLMMSDRFFIKQLISVEMAGIYGIAYKFGMILNMVLVTPFVQAWQPILFRLENDPGQKLTYQRVALQFMQMAAFAWLGLSVISKYLVMWTTTADYYAGIPIVPWIAFSYLLYGLQNIFNAGALIYNQTFKMTVYGVISALVNIILNFVLIPRWEMMGAAVATVASYLLMMLLILQLSQRKLPVNWRWEKMLAVMGLGFLCYALSLVSLKSQLNVMKDAVMVLLFPVLLVMLKLVSFEEVKRFILRFQSM